MHTHHDRRGNPIVGTAAATETYDRAVDALLRFSPEVVDLAAGLAKDEPGFAMGQALTAYLYLMGTDAPDLPVAAAAADALAVAAGGEREAMHLGAIRAWLRGDWVGAAEALDAVLLRWPADLLALSMGHQLDFFVGDAVNLRDRPARTLPAVGAGSADAGFVRGMHAFGLEESGDLRRAEEAGLQALAANRDDVWAVHAVVHAYEMGGRVDEGISFLRGRQEDWGQGNLFTVHNWWHLALFCLEAGAVGEALAIYDREVHHGESSGVPLEMLDASALLWRLFLDGVDVSGRAAVLADAWATRTADEPWYAFNDVHAVMALVLAGRIGEARQRIDDLARWLQPGPTGTNVMMTARVGLPVSRAIVAYGEGRDADVVAELAPIRREVHRFGGSHAQRDAVQRTLLDAALRSGQLDLARALLAERLSARETSVYGWTRQARLDAARGEPDRSEAARQRARRHQERFAAALG